MALYYLRKRRWLTLLAAGATGLALGLAPFLALGGAAFGDWLTIARYFGGSDYPAYPSNQSARGLLLRAFVGGPSHQPRLAFPPLADALWVVVVLVALALWWRCTTGETATPRRAATEFGLTAALILHGRAAERRHSLCHGVAAAGRPGRPRHRSRRPAVARLDGPGGGGLPLLPPTLVGYVLQSGRGRSAGPARLRRLPVRPRAGDRRAGAAGVASLRRRAVGAATGRPVEHEAAADRPYGCPGGYEAGG